MPGLQGISLGSMEREEGLNRIHVRDLREEGGREGERETGGGPVIPQAYARAKGAGKARYTFFEPFWTPDVEGS